MGSRRRPSQPRWVTAAESTSLFWRLEQILVWADSVLDGMTVAAASGADREATILAVKRAIGEPTALPGTRGERPRATASSCWAPLSTLDARAASASPAVYPDKPFLVEGRGWRSAG